MNIRSIGSKVTLSIIIVSIISLVFATIVLFSLQKDTKIEIYSNIEKDLKQSAKQRLNAKKQIGLTNAISIANDGRVKKSLKTNDRKWAIISLKDVSSKMKKNTKFKNIKVHMHTKNNRSFVRNWKLDKYGDDLSSFRKSIVHVNSTKESLATFEAGKSGLVLRGITPIMDDNGMHLGSLEFMQGLNSVAKAFDKNQNAFMLLMDKKLKRNDLNNNSIDSSKIYKNYIISQKFINNDFLADSKIIDLNQLFENGYILSEKYFYTYIDIKDFENKKLGIALLAEPLTIVNKTIDHAQLIIKIALGIIAIMAFAISTISLIIIRKLVSNPLKKFEKGLLDFFAFIERTKPDANTIDVNSKDEIGEMSKVINKSISKIKQEIEQDKILIKEIDDVIEKVDNGFYYYTVKGSSSNPLTMEMKNTVNNLVKGTNTQLNLVVETLIKYGESDFKFDYDLNKYQNMNGAFGSLIATTMLIGNNVSELIAMILNAGEKLNHDTDVLSETSTNLSRASQEQAASLEETAAALEEITSTIVNNNSNIQEIIKNSKLLTESVNTGQNLANETAVSMDEINTQVTAINEAITVIDQIAFQTNILSLNAAVEAATAGEAGKGFAVVAQEVRNLAARSAEAAKEIKEMVENATSKANDGKNISDHMIKGYRELNSNIQNTIGLIDDIASASKEQEEGIDQINDAVAQLDQETQKNASEASRISDLVDEVSILSNNLVLAASRASFKEEARKQVDDVELVFQTAKLKNDHIRFKESNFIKLDKFSKDPVVDHHSCHLGKWIDEQIKSNKGFTKTNSWDDFMDAHEIVHSKVKEYMYKSADRAANSELKKISQEIERATIRVFNGLNNVKIENNKS